MFKKKINKYFKMGLYLAATLAGGVYAGGRVKSKISEYQRRKRNLEYLKDSLDKADKKYIDVDSL